MPTQTQVRPPLTDTVQQFGSTPMGAVTSLQIQALTAAGAMLAEKDLLVADATAGTFIVTLPATPYVGKPYTVKEISGANSITVDAAGAGTIDGAATLAIAAREAATLVPRAIDQVTGLVTWDAVSQTAPNPGAGGTLLAANNLSDVANASTAAQNLGALEAANNLLDVASAVDARANIGANTRAILFSDMDFVAANARAMRLVWRGPDGTITNIDAVADYPTDGTVIVTASIEGVPVTNGVATIPLSVAAGGVGSAVPTAANVITAGQRLELAISGTNTLITLGEIGVWVTY